MIRTFVITTPQRNVIESVNVAETAYRRVLPPESCTNIRTQSDKRSHVADNVKCHKSKCQRMFLCTEFRKRHESCNALAT